MQVMYALWPITDDIHSVSTIPCLQKTVLSPFQLFIPLHIHIAVLPVDSKKKHAGLFYQSNDDKFLSVSCTDVPTLTLMRI